MTSSIPSKEALSKYTKGSGGDETKGFLMQQAMIRVKDPIKSLEFYTGVLGMKLIMYRDFPQWGFTVYFVGYTDAAIPPQGSVEGWNMCMNIPGTVELTWNHGSELEEGDVYNTGNSDSTGSKDGNPVRGGFGHLGITCKDVYAACERFKKLGVAFKKTPNSGGMKGLAFIKDPDGYMIEILPQGSDDAGSMPTKEVDCDGIKLDGSGGYSDSSKPTEGKETPAPLTLFVTLDVKEDKVAEFLEVAKLDAQGSRKEKGCLRFDVMKEPNDKEHPHRYYFYEVYKDEASLEFHRTTPHYKKWAEWSKDGLAAKSVSRGQQLYNNL